jgi:DNA-binding response OmpR family regulator
MEVHEFRPIQTPADAYLQRPSRPTHRILVADDEPIIRRLIASILIGSGYHVDAAEDGAVAWEALQTKAYDLLITDNNMPRLSGVELVHNLRSARMALPVVMVAGPMSEDEIPSLQLAAMLPKPFAMSALLDTVENVLRVTDRPFEQIDPLPHWRTQPAASGLWL